MAKKYIFFKLASTIIDEEESATFSKTELEAFFPSIKPIKNIFELFTYHDLKLSIEKDHLLQHDLTKALPAGYLHGYLTMTDDIINVEKLVKNLAYINEIFLFQKTVENADTYLTYLLAIQLARQYTVYNWDIFKIPSLQNFYERLYYNEVDYSSESDVINKINQIKGYDDNYLLDLDHSYYCINDYNNIKVIRSVLNFLSSNGGKTVITPSGYGEIIFFASLMGISSIGIERNAIKVLFNRARYNTIFLDLELFRKAIGALLVSVDDIINEKTSAQSNLFFNDAKESFKNYIQNKLSDLKKCKSIKIHPKNIEEILAAYYLIKNNIITEKEELNQILTAAIIQSIFSLLYQNEEGRVKNIVSKNIKRLYFDFYIFDQLKHIFALNPVASDFKIDSFLNLDKKSFKRVYNIICLLSDYDAKLIEDNFFNDILKILDINNESNNTGSSAFNISPLSKKQKDVFLLDFQHQGEHYEKLGSYAQKKLGQLMSSGRKDELTVMFKLCIDCFDLIESLSTILVSNGNLCFICPNYSKDVTLESFVLSKVIEEIIEKHKDIFGLSFDRKLIAKYLPNSKVKPLNSLTTSINTVTSEEIVIFKKI